MATCSFVLVGTEGDMAATFGSTCHGAGGALSRNASRRLLKLKKLKHDGIAIRLASPKLVTDESRILQRYH